jgi:hypothetical protein
MTRPPGAGLEVDGSEWSKDPNADTFDHVGERDTLGAPVVVDPGIHVADVLDESGLQLCQRCRRILVDYRGTMIPAGSPSLNGWPVGAFVEVDGENPRSSVLTVEAPTCEIRT